MYLHCPRVFHNLMVLSRDPETIWRLSAEKATLRTSLVWPTNWRVVVPLIRNHKNAQKVWSLQSCRPVNILFTSKEFSKHWNVLQQFQTWLLFWTLQKALFLRSYACRTIKMGFNILFQLLANLNTHQLLFNILPRDCDSFAWHQRIHSSKGNWNANHY